MDIIQGKTTVSEAARQFDLSPSEIEEWVDQGKAGMENALRAKPEDIREQYERQLRDLQKPMEKPCWSSEREEIPVPVGQGRAMIEAIRQGLKADGFEVSISKLCSWFGVARRSFYYKASRAAPHRQPGLF